MPGFELVGEEERVAVNEVFEEGGALFRHGFDAMRRKGRFRVVEFEQAFAKYFGVEHALAVASGTAALKVGLKALGVGPGDEVITQAFTFVATVEAILDTGAKPVVVNGDDTLNMDPDEVERHITPQTKAILPVHMLGVSPEMDRILTIARKHELMVLEDNCESPGATYDGRYLGTLGDIAAFSFDFGKMLTTGEGGMVVAKDPNHDALVREYHDHGHENNPALPRGRDTHRIHGFNYRMGELQGAIGLVQLQRLAYMVTENRKHYLALQEGIEGIEGITLRKVPARCESLCDALIFQVPSKDQAVRFVECMTELGIGTKNLPDAMEWHFAGYWDHMCDGLELSKEALWASLEPTYERLSRSIALPIMVKYTPERVQEMVYGLNRIAAEVLC